MSGVSITASSTNLGSTGSTGATGGSAAERAYALATKALDKAQRKQSTDVMNKAGQDTLDSDKLAVEAASLAVNTAAAAVAVEKQQQQAKADEPKPAQADNHDHQQASPEPGTSVDRYL